MSAGGVESDYYEFMEFDRDNARNVLGYYTRFFRRGPVLELASGPGVFLDLLRENGIESRGVDIEEGMVAQARRNGHAVVRDDALNHLRELPARSLEGLFAAHFLEHLQSHDVQAVYAEAARVLTPGGIFVAAVPNAACLSVLTFDFWRDPTHVRFYDPVALQFFARQAGLEIVASGGNPLNHPGAPQDVRPPDAYEGSSITSPVRRVVLDARASLDAMEERVNSGRRAGKRIDGVAEQVADIVAQLGHLITVLNDHALALGHEVAKLRASNAALVERLYPSNEVFVVARSPGGTVTDEGVPPPNAEDG